MNNIPQTYYVYVLCRPNGRPFYVGKGKNNRVYDHEAEAHKGCKCHKCNIIRKIWHNGGEVQRYIMLTTPNEQDALDYECELIALHGRKNLCNLTDGGEGVSGRIVSKESRKKIATTLKGRKHSPDHRRRNSEVRKGIKQNPELVEKRAAALRGRKNGPLSEEVKQKLSLKNRGYQHTEEARRKISEAGRGRVFSEERRRKISEAQKGKPKPAWHIERLLEGRRKYIPTEEDRRKMSEAQRQRPKIKYSALARDHNALAQSGGKSYTIVAPDGTRYEGVINASLFAEQHGLRGNLLRMVLRGERPHHKGWTGWVE